MAINLSVDKSIYSEKIKKLREKLDKTKENGILDETFEKNLEELLEYENKILQELIPYYRKSEKYETTIKINKIKENGSFKFNNYLTNIIKLKENLYLVSNNKKEVQFLQISKEYDYYNKEYYIYELSHKIKEINENISYINKINNSQILLLSNLGNIYEIEIKNLDKLPNIYEDIRISKIKNNLDIREFGRVLEISKNTFIIENGDNKINLLKIDNKFNLKIYKQIYIKINNWTLFEKISENYFVIGTNKGEIYFIKYTNQEFVIEDILEIKDFELRKMAILEDENKKKNNLIILGNNGKFKIISIKDKKIKLEENNLSGNLFDIYSQKGTAIILSENGNMYLIEENFEEWKLSKKEIKDKFYINIFGLEDLNYIFIDLDANFNIASVQRITKPDELRKESIY